MMFLYTVRGIVERKRAESEFRTQRLFAKNIMAADAKEAIAKCEASEPKTLESDPGDVVMVLVRIEIREVTIIAEIEIV